MKIKNIIPCFVAAYFFWGLSSALADCNSDYTAASNTFTVVAPYKISVNKVADPNVLNHGHGSCIAIVKRNNTRCSMTWTLNNLTGSAQLVDKDGCANK